MIEWEVQAKEFVNCNCAYGCPCQFNALPTHGNCQAIAAYDISKGQYGDVKLNGLKVVGIFSWPGAGSCRDGRLSGGITGGWSDMGAIISNPIRR